MLEAAELVETLIAFLQPKLLPSVHVLLTAGPTFEPLDPVRGLTNSSSGKMGFALARACSEAGAEVTLVAGPVSLPTPLGVRRVDVQTAMQMRAAVMHELPGQQVFIGVAAVADYRPMRAEDHKIKKSSGTLALELEANPDILAEVAATANAPMCVGFAAESRDLAKYSEGKRLAKNLALVVGNLVQDGLGGDSNEVTLFDANGSHPLPRGDKLCVARAIVMHMANLMEKSHASH